MYKIRVRGEKDYVIINDNELGYRLQEDWKSGKLEGQKVDTPAGSFEGTDIRAVFPVDVDSPELKLPEFTDAEMQDFDKELDEFKLKEGTAAYQKLVWNILDDLRNKEKPLWTEFTVWYIDEARKRLEGEKNPDAWLQEAHKIVKARMVGNIVDWDAWLLKNKIIYINDDGARMLITDAGGRVLYVEASARMDAYNAWKKKKEYGEFQKLKELAGSEV